MKQTARSLAPLVVAVAAGIGFASAVAYWPHHEKSPIAEGQSLLGKAADLFTDEQIGLQFRPPKDWSMQGRTLATSSQMISPRLIVKYKRLIPKVQVAWLRVFAIQSPAEQSPSDYLKKRKLPEKNWKVTKEVEAEVQLGNQKAARITYAGPLDPDGRGSKEYTAEFYAIRRGNTIIELSGMFPTTDEEARKQLQKAIESVTFSN